MGLFPRLKASLAMLFGSAEDPRAASGSVYRRQAELLDRLERAAAELRGFRFGRGRQPQTGPQRSDRAALTSVRSAAIENEE